MCAPKSDIGLRYCMCSLPTFWFLSCNEHKSRYSVNNTTPFAKEQLNVRSSGMGLPYHYKNSPGQWRKEICLRDVSCTWLSLEVFLKKRRKTVRTRRSNRARE
ncbi:uncharacterized protein LOC119648125 isoform X2 [Hermetia illucens]|uniref:uncharacterized protein LOC119648125 isoform X2 n=1 Tax=Hermetia illucens TaxID=343691 RepID=UPI0018CC34C7|nr:uncharacterized protein LOC119648125 isoform X2 [Hermetia illucens]